MIFFIINIPVTVTVILSHCKQTHSTIHWNWILNIIQPLLSPSVRIVDIKLCIGKVININLLQRLVDSILVVAKSKFIDFSFFPLIDILFPISLANWRLTQASSFSALVSIIFTCLMQTFSVFLRQRITLRARLSIWFYIDWWAIFIC